jgi:hypothetical protein
LKTVWWRSIRLIRRMSRRRRLSKSWIVVFELL